MKKSTKIFNVVALGYVSVCLVSTLILSIFLGDEFLAWYHCLFIFGYTYLFPMLVSVPSIIFSLKIYSAGYEKNIFSKLQDIFTSIILGTTSFCLILYFTEWFFLPVFELPWIISFTISCLIISWISAGAVILLMIGNLIYLKKTYR